jgi:hypothetical protein
MAGTAFLNKKFIKDAVRAGLYDALEVAGNRVAADAKGRAPIRKVFKEKSGYRRKFRTLTADEKNLAIKRANLYYGKSGTDLIGRRPRQPIESYEAKVQIARRGSANSPGNSMTLRLLGHERNGRFQSASGSTPNRRGGGFEPSESLGKALTLRGKYEVRSGAAIHREVEGMGESTRVQIGGALKASIGSEGVVQTGTGVKVTVSAAIGYAKFVEFPTIRTSAQPFLLPALHAERGRLQGDIAAAIKKNLGG